MLSHDGIAELYTEGCCKVKRNRGKALDYLLELERAGYVAGSLFQEIGKYYLWYGDGSPDTQSISMDYTDMGIKLKDATAYLDRFMLWHLCAGGTIKNKEKAVQLLVEAEKRGIEDDVLLNELVNSLMLSSYTPSARVLGRFRDRAEMALHYSDVLIQRKSPRGYHWKSRLYLEGKHGIPQNKRKALAIWKEGERLGLIDFPGYIWGVLRFSVEQVYVTSHCEP